jgi:hypothetical protein
MAFPVGTGTQEGEEGAGRGRSGVLGKEGGLQAFLVYLASLALLCAAALMRLVVKA